MVTKTDVTTASTMRRRVIPFSLDECVDRITKPTLRRCGLAHSIVATRTNTLVDSAEAAWRRIAVTSLIRTLAEELP
jgi:hypothetical protein